VIFLNFFLTGQSRPKRKLGRNLPKIKLGQNRPKREPTCGWTRWLDSTEPRRLGWYSSPKEPIYWLWVTVLSTLILKENKMIFFWNFWHIGLGLLVLINWLLKSKCMLKHICFFFKIFFVWKYDVIFFYLRDLAVCIKKIYFLIFWWKPSILIPDLYLYDIKIQTNINQNVVKNFHRKITNFEMFFFWICLIGRTLPKRKLGWNLPKMKSGENRPEREPTCGWTQPSRVGWADVPARKNQYTGCGLLCWAQ